MIVINNFQVFNTILQEKKNKLFKYEIKTLRTKNMLENKTK